MLIFRFFKLIAHEHLNVRSPTNISETLKFLCEIIEEQKPVTSWLQIFQETSDPIKCTDMLVNLTLPTEVLNKFDQILSKNTDLSIQFLSMKFLSSVLARVQQALTMINSASLACNRTTVNEAYQQAILRVTFSPLSPLVHLSLSLCVVHPQTGSIV